MPATPETVPARVQDGPSTPATVRARIAQAGRATRASSAAAERDSRAALDGFLARSLEGRFAALEDGAAQLLPEHRRELLASLREKTAATAPAAGGAAVRHASRFAVWRVRLPFQARRLTRDGLLALCLAAAIGLAYRHTPVTSAEVQGERDRVASWITPEGRQEEDRLVAGRAYAVMRLAGGMAELRDWRPGEGYAETRVPVGWLRARAEPNRTGAEFGIHLGLRRTPDASSSRNPTHGVARPNGVSGPEGSLYTMRSTLP